MYANNIFNTVSLPRLHLHMHLTDAFIQSDLQLHSGYTFLISICVPWESNPQPFALLTQCSTTEPQGHLRHLLYQTSTFTCMHLADAFIQKMLIQALHLLSVCVFPGN